MKTTTYHNMQEEQQYTGVCGLMVRRFACHAEDPSLIPVWDDLIFLRGFFPLSPLCP